MDRRARRDADMPETLRTRCARRPDEPSPRPRRRWWHPRRGRAAGAPATGSTRSARSPRCSPACCSPVRSSRARCRSRPAGRPSCCPSSPTCRPGSATLGSLASAHQRPAPAAARPVAQGASARAARDPYADIDGPALVAGLRGVRLRRPGARPAYSNLGFGLLGHALATHRRDDVRRGRPRADHGAARHGRHGLRAGDRPGWCPARRGAGSRTGWHGRFDALAGAGALWSTVNDLVVFLRAQLEPPEGPLGEAMRLSHRTDRWSVAGSSRRWRGSAVRD